MSAKQTMQEINLVVEDIGGIDRTTATFHPGVTLLVGRNATNRTSLLQGIMAGFGSDNVSIKGDANEAKVELSIEDDMYTRYLKRRNGQKVSEGEPYLGDPTLPDLFAFLLGSNEARRAVANSDDLREIIMRPVDTDEIQAEIEGLVQRRNEIDQELEEIESLKKQLPPLEEERTQLRDRIEVIKEELAETEKRLDESDADLQQTKDEKAELEEKLSELRQKRSRLEDIRFDAETERDSIQSLRSDKHDLEAELAELPETPIGEIEELDNRIERLRNRKQQLKSKISDIQNVIQFNEEVIDGSNEEIAAILEQDDQVTDKLLPDEEVTCWTCGSEVEMSQIDSTVGQLREYTQEKREESREIQNELDEIKENRRELEQKQRRREDVQQRLQEIEREIETSEATIEELTEQKAEIQDEITEIEAEIEDHEDETYEEILDLHREANQLEYDLGKAEGNLNSVEEKITNIEDRITEQEDLEEKRAELTDEISTLRGEIDRIEKQAIEEFNEHMDTVLDLLDYENLDRIWIERVKVKAREGRRKVSKNKFNLHVVRKTDNNATYEDTINHLSESEHEVTGLIFALAGYLAHEVYEQVPLVILDSLEAIDAERIRILIEYLSEYTEYLIAALLPEDAATLDDGYHRIREI